MNRLTSGMVALLAVALVGACSGDPTADLRTGVSALTASPSTLNVTLGKNKTTLITAVDEQGNQISTAFDVSAVGPGISVKRDSTYLPIYLSDSTLSVPPEAPAFQYVVTATDLTTSSFKVSAGGHDVTIPVVVSADPLQVPAATVASTGPSASDTTVITLPAPYIFGPNTAVAFDAGAAILVSIAADGSSIKIFPPPGAASTGQITGVVLNYLPQAELTDTTNVPLAISTVVPPQPGTGSPATAPDITPAPGATTAFYDGAAFGSSTCGVFNDGANCQLYKINLPAPGALAVSATWSNTTDLGVYVLSADGTADVVGSGSPCDVNGNGADGGAESCSFDLPAGPVLLAVVNFGPFYNPPDPAPDWIALTITAPQ